MTLISVVLVLFIASWRISMLMSDADEGGPYGILNIIRDKVGVRFDERSVPYGTNMLANMWVCYLCNSFWIGVVLASIMYFSPLVAFYIGLPFAISGAVILIQERK